MSNQNTTTNAAVATQADYSEYTHIYSTAADTYGEATDEQRTAMNQFIKDRAPVLFPGLRVQAGLETKTRGPEEDVCEEINRVIGDAVMGELATL